ncbi:hypothetical protein HDV00_007017 [Rhizophlyctis rosea]|nr:hypothetical protein HDV00_007017 [Rhizophlyctis rosea]
MPVSESAAAETDDTEHRNVTIQLYPDDERCTVLVAVVQSLIMCGNRPSSPKELAAYILKKRLAVLGGQTPYATVSSRISQHFRRAADNNRPPILGKLPVLESNRPSATAQPRKWKYYIDHPEIQIGDAEKEMEGIEGLIGKSMVEIEEVIRRETESGDAKEDGDEQGPSSGKGGGKARSKNKKAKLRVKSRGRDSGFSEDLRIKSEATEGSDGAEQMDLDGDDDKADTRDPTSDSTSTAATPSASTRRTRHTSQQTKSSRHPPATPISRPMSRSRHTDKTPQQHHPTPPRSITASTASPPSSTLDSAASSSASSDTSSDASSSDREDEPRQEASPALETSDEGEEVRQESEHGGFRESYDAGVSSEEDEKKGSHVKRNGGRGAVDLKKRKSRVGGDGARPRKRRTS